MIFICSGGIGRRLKVRIHDPNYCDVGEGAAEVDSAKRKQRLSIRMWTMPINTHTSNRQKEMYLCRMQIPACINYLEHKGDVNA